MPTLGRYRNKKQSEHNNVDAMTELFTQNLIDVCEQAGLRFNNITRKHIEKPWFEVQCNDIYAR